MNNRNWRFYQVYHVKLFLNFSRILPNLIWPESKSRREHYHTKIGFSKCCWQLGSIFPSHHIPRCMKWKNDHSNLLLFLRNGLREKSMNKLFLTINTASIFFYIWISQDFHTLLPFSLGSFNSSWRTHLHSHAHAFFFFNNLLHNGIYIFFCVTLSSLRGFLSCFIQYLLLYFLILETAERWDASRVFNLRNLAGKTRQ